MQVVLRLLLYPYAGMQSNEVPIAKETLVMFFCFDDFACIASKVCVCFSWPLTASINSNG